MSTTVYTGLGLPGPPRTFVAKTEAVDVTWRTKQKAGGMWAGKSEADGSWAAKSKVSGTWVPTGEA